MGKWSRNNVQTDNSMLHHHLITLAAATYLLITPALSTSHWYKKVLMSQYKRLDTTMQLMILNVWFVKNCNENYDIQFSCHNSTSFIVKMHSKMEKIDYCPCHSWICIPDLDYKILMWPSNVMLQSASVGGLSNLPEFLFCVRLLILLWLCVGSVLYQLSSWWECCCRCWSLFIWCE